MRLFFSSPIGDKVAEVSRGHGVSPSSHIFFLSYIHIILSSYKEVSGLANNDPGKMMITPIPPQTQSLECLHKDFQFICSA